MRIDELLAGCGSRTCRRPALVRPPLDARLFLQHLTGLDRSQLVLRGQRARMTPKNCRALARISFGAPPSRSPWQYLTGFQEFWSMDFAVSPAVLIPRPETEFLLEQVLATCSGNRLGVRALDMCTGSGVIRGCAGQGAWHARWSRSISPRPLCGGGRKFSGTTAGERSSRRLAICSPALAPATEIRSLCRVQSPLYCRAQIDHLEPEVAGPSLAAPSLAVPAGWRSSSN